MRPLPVVVAALFVASALAGCLGASTGKEASDEDAVDPTALAAAGLTTYLHNLSEELPGVTVLNSILEQARIPTLDGVRLDAWVVRPNVAQPVPLILQVTPYWPGGPPVNAEGTGHSLGMLGNTMVPRGYAYGIVSVRGTGNSEGCFTQAGPSEAKDTAAAIEYFAAQPWSNGRVGLIGVSYPGTTPQDVWVEAPPSLKTIVPISGISDMYKYNFVNGVHLDPQGIWFNTYYWVYVGLLPSGHPNSLPQAMRDPAHFLTGVAGNLCPEQLDVQKGGTMSFLTGNKDAYWLVRDFRLKLLANPEQERASVFFIHGLQDWNVKPHMMEDWLDAVQDTGVPVKIWLGQWGHAWPQREDWWNATLIAWFDQFLKEVDTGILDAPAVQVQDDQGRWRHETHWPPRDTESLVLYPKQNGRLEANPGGWGAVRYHDRMGGRAPGDLDLGPDRVVWASDLLQENITISGLPVFEAHVTASGKRASLILTLVERSEAGDRSINFAALSLNHAQDLTLGDPDIAGKTQHVVVRFFPQDDTVKAGSQLVLIASGNRIGGPGPNLQPVSDGSMIRIDTAQARLVLPIDTSLAYEEPPPCWERECYLIQSPLRPSS